MRKIIVIVVILAVLCLTFVGCDRDKSKDNNDFLRIHIRANSNSQVDQQVKYEVKSAIVEYLIPHLANATSKQEAQSIVGGLLSQLSDVANSALVDNGFNYGAQAVVAREQFPTRQYDNLVLESGVYDALIVRLGSGSGDNWWCVVYPPLCFIGGQASNTDQITYKSLLVEIIDKFFNVDK